MNVFNLYNKLCELINDGYGECRIYYRQYEDDKELEMVQKSKMFEYKDFEKTKTMIINMTEEEFAQVIPNSKKIEDVIKLY
ncbi:MAG TPA: hypothetical protein GXZ35_07935 [Acholeplasmataceae bacterium]|nr:hypothetical protein [Acholeplasmataceae bacterium]